MTPLALWEAAQRWLSALLDRAVFAAVLWAFGAPDVPWPA